MLSKNLIIFIIILFLIGIIVYFYYNNNHTYPKLKNLDNVSQKNNPQCYNSEKFMTLLLNKTHDQYPHTLRMTNTNSYYPKNKKDKINSYCDNKSNNKFCKKRKKQIINVDSILEKYPDLYDNMNAINYYNYETDNYTYANNKIENDDIYPANLTKNNNNWDTNFDNQIIDKNEMSKYFEKIKKDNKKIIKAISDFKEYQDDRSNVIEKDAPDPFKHVHHSQGRAIKDIYDEQVSNPKPVPKKIKTKTKNEIIYDNEDVMNGGKIKGTSLSGYNLDNSYKDAKFHNDF